MISVVTITFNNCDELKKTLNSISSIQNLESVVINGGSSQDSIELLKSHPGIVVNEKDEGIADAFNKGYLKSNGVAVVFLNSGDVLVDKGYYSWANRIFTDHPEVAFTYSDIVFEDIVAGDYILKPRGEGIEDLGKGLPFPHPSLIVRRSVFDQIGGFSKDFKIAMDFDFVVRMLKAGYRGKYYPHSTVRMDGLGISSSREISGIGECRKSLIQNGLFHSKIKRDYFERIAKYQIRFLVEKILGKQALRALKVLKSKLS
jgi:GT2 family glycosyltransferase